MGTLSAWTSRRPTRARCHSLIPVNPGFSRYYSLTTPGQIDGAVASLGVLEKTFEAVGENIYFMFGSGVWWASDVVKGACTWCNVCICGTVVEFEKEILGDIGPAE